MNINLAHTICFYTSSWSLGNWCEPRKWCIGQVFIVLPCSFLVLSCSHICCQSLVDFFCIQSVSTFVILPLFYTCLFPHSCVYLFSIPFFLRSYLFLYLRERECEQGSEQREGRRNLKGRRPPHRAQSQEPEIMTWAEPNQESDAQQLSHPGAHAFLFFSNILFCACACVSTFISCTLFLTSPSQSISLCTCLLHFWAASNVTILLSSWVFFSGFKSIFLDWIPCLV